MSEVQTESATPKPFAGSVTTHWGHWDTLLVRVGHYLWKWHKQNRTNRAFTAALDDIWAAKREFRRPTASNRGRKRIRAQQIHRQMHIRRASLTADFTEQFVN